MYATLLLLTLLADPLGAGDHDRALVVDGLERTYLVHVPPKYDATKPTPVVLILHGASTNGVITVALTGLNKKADEAGFIAVYPDGTGFGPFLTWNAGGVKGNIADGKPDDVKFIAELLDDLATVLIVDRKRVYATGFSNGGMMCYRLAAELSDRIAAIAPVAGTMTMDRVNPKRPVSVIHFHGTDDTFVPFKGPNDRTPAFLTFKSVDVTVRTWAKADGCLGKPKIIGLPKKTDDGTSVKRKSFGPSQGGDEVVLYIIEGGGHSWPGTKSPAESFIGKATENISANDLMWEFFERHPMK
jgi:polyhydroxybutyrate depolymerase